MEHTFRGHTQAIGTLTVLLRGAVLRRHLNPAREAGMRNTLAGCAAMLIATATLPLQAEAQQRWPERPVRIIVPLPPGSAVDVVARLFAAIEGPEADKLATACDIVDR